MLRIGPEGRADFINAIRNDEGFTVDIRHDSLPRFDSEDFDESQFLSVLINVLHLLISHRDIGLDYAAIVRDGIGCEENKLKRLAAGMQYLVSVMFPTSWAHATDASVPGTCTCVPLHMCTVCQANVPGSIECVCKCG